MNRRDLLLATTGALASAAAGSAFAKAGGGLLPPGTGSSGATLGASCVLIPAQPAQRVTMGLRELCVKRFFPSLVDGPNRLEHLTLDLQLLDERSQLQTVFAWQLARASSASWSGGFRMRLTDQQVNLVVNLRKRGSRTTESWSSRMVGGDSILATPRASTGRVPSAADLRLDPDKPELWLADGSPRDFDALLLSAI